MKWNWELFWMKDVFFPNLIGALCFSVSREQGKRANLKTGVSRKQSTPNFPKNKHFLPPDTDTCAYQGVRHVRFVVFLKHPFWDSPFCLITDKLIWSLLLLSWSSFTKRSGGSVAGVLCWFIYHVELTVVTLTQDSSSWNIDQANLLHSTQLKSPCQSKWLLKLR